MVVQSFVFFAICCTYILSAFGLPEIEPSRIKMPETITPASTLPNQDWWKWHNNNPYYVDYWQRDPARRPWTPRPGYTYGPDSQYTYQTYDTPEFFGYDSLYPGGRTHFIGYKTQDRKISQGQLNNNQQHNWKKFNNGFPTTEIPNPLKPFVYNDNINRGSRK